MHTEARQLNNHKTFTLMKKLIFFAMLVLSGLRSGAQTATLTLITPPCDSNGVIVATFTGMPTPFDVTWWTTYNTVQHFTITATTDTLFGYAGGYVSMSAYDSITGTYVSDSLTYGVPFTVIDSSVAVTCPALGTVTATVSGGTGPYTYKWRDGSTGAVVATTNPAVLPTGYYYVRVTDVGTGCVSGFTTPAIEVMTSPDFTQTVTTTPAVCPSLGAGMVTVTGGTPPFIYAWTNPSGITTTGTASTMPLAPCYYAENTTDANGCVAFGGSWDVGYVPDFTATVTATTANCTNGTASTAITGGTGPFSYLWSNGATTANLSGLVTGYYTVKITDGTGCVDSSGIDSALTAYVPQSIYISVMDAVTPATCIDSNGSIVAFGSGGMPPYSFVWSNGATTASVGSLSAGYYDVTVTDANGCLGWGTEYVGSSTPIVVSYSSTPSLCTGPTGTATLAISGGTAPYNVTWYTSPIQTGITASSLPSGYYYFFITDAMGCTQSGSVYVPPVDVIYLSFTSTPATCLASDGSVSVSASGGVAPYSYSWASGGTTPSLSGVPYGTYYATVTDANNCTVTNCQNVPYTSPITLGLSSSPASCLYANDGSITAVANYGTPPYVFSMGGSSSGTVTIPGLPTDPYWISVTDAHGCDAIEYTYVDYNALDSSCFCEIQGNVYVDANHNCTQDAGEVGIQNIQMYCSGIGYTYTDATGFYYFLVPTGTYTVSQTVLGIYPLSPCQANNIPVSVTAAAGCHNIVNFADTLDPIHDMHISTWDYNVARPGFPYTQITVVTNDGTLTEPNILTAYMPDTQILAPTFVPAGYFTGAPAPDYYNTAATSFSLAPGVGQQFLMNYNVPADVPLGTVLTFRDTAAYVSPLSNWLSDYSPWNNICYFNTTTVGSYDPNFKEVSPKGWGPDGVITVNDSVLEYMVHFQNTGSYMAENVVVKDTLDPSLDWKTLRPVYMSNKCVVDIDEHGVATFTFNHINLPASSAEPIASNAMFTYTVKQRPALALGTRIQNSASIYFDFNAPIKTNKTRNTIAWSAGVQNTAAATSGTDAFTVYPNPANNTFNAIINSNEAGSYGLKITDVAGKTEISKTLNIVKGSQTITVDVNHLSAGVYFVTLAGSDGKLETQKLVIIK